MKQEWVRNSRAIVILSSCIFAILVPFWFMTPAKALIAGFILGGAISVFNVLYLAHRLKLAGQLALAGSQKLVGTKPLNRMLMIGFGIIITYRFPEWFDYRTLLLGFLMSYVIMVVVACFNIYKEKSQREGRGVLGTDSEA